MAQQRKLVTNAAAPEKSKSGLSGIFKSRRLSVHEKGTNRGTPSSFVAGKEGLDGNMAIDLNDNSGRRSSSSSSLHSSQRSMFGLWKRSKMADDGMEKSNLRQNSMSPRIIDTLDVRMEDALLTTLDIPSYSGTGTVADLRRSPAYAVALKANEDALCATANILGDDHPDVISRKLSTADIYKGLGMMREAVDLLQEVIDSQKRSKGLSTDELARTLNDLALIYGAINRHQEAEALFQEVVAMLSKAHDGVHPDIAVALGNMAVMMRKSYQYSRAISVHERAVKVMGAIMGKDTSETAYQRALFGVTLLHAGEKERGQVMLTDAISQLIKLGYKSDHQWVKVLRAELT